MKKRLLALLLCLCLLCAALSVNVLAETAADGTPAVVTEDGVPEETAAAAPETPADPEPADGAPEDEPAAPADVQDPDNDGEPDGTVTTPVTPEDPDTTATPEDPDGDVTPNEEVTTPEEPEDPVTTPETPDTTETPETPDNGNETPEIREYIEMRIVSDMYDVPADVLERIEKLSPVTVRLNPDFAATLQADDYISVSYTCEDPTPFTYNGVTSVTLMPTVQVMLRKAVTWNDGSTYYMGYEYGSEEFPLNALTDPVVTLCFPLPNVFRDCGNVYLYFYNYDESTGLTNEDAASIWDQANCCMYITTDIANYLDTGRASLDFEFMGTVSTVAKPEAADVSADIPAELEDTANTLAQDVSKVELPQMTLEEGFLAGLQADDHVSLDYKLEEMTADEDGTVTSFAMEVKPIVRHADGSTDIIGNDKLTGSVIFQIPVPKAMADAFAYASVKHDGETFPGTFNIYQNGPLYYIEVTTSSFSLFEVTGTNTAVTITPAPDPAPAAPAASAAASNVPKTSGNTHSALWGMLTVLSLGGLAVLTLGRKKLLEK